MHWAQKYIGKPYAEADCAELAAQVLRDEFGHDLALPTERGESVFSLSDQIAKRQGDYAERVSTPSEGDAVLMRSRGRLNHVGVYCVVNGDAYVLHAMRNARQTCLHRLHDLNRVGLEIEGFYRWL